MRRQIRGERSPLGSVKVLLSRSIMNIEIPIRRDQRAEDARRAAIRCAVMRGVGCAWR
jgi:hypothetical protein